MDNSFRKLCEQKLTITADEVVIALVQPVGTDLNNIRDRLSEAAKKMNATFIYVNLTELVESIDFGNRRLSELRADKVDLLKGEQKKSSEFRELSEKMHVGTLLRKYLRQDVFSVYGLARIHNARITHSEGKKIVYLLDSLKHPSEVKLLRDTYGSSFLLVGVSTDRKKREVFLRSVRGMKPQEASELISRDESEEGEDGTKMRYGQKMTATFEQSDYFLENTCTQTDVDRFMELCFGNSKLAPKKNELFMHLASAAAAQSSDLSRQVGAALVSNFGELLSIGTNEVPKFGGGQYATGDTPDVRDVVLGYDPNHKRRDQIKEGVDEATSKVREMLENLTEFHRAVHAEMEALISCGRKGISTVGSVLYTTTYPCHNCAKHMIDAGVRRVVFIEAYPKSLAQELHHDALSDDLGVGNSKMILESYTGTGPRRFLDFFSQSLSIGIMNARKGDVVEKAWKASVFDSAAAKPKFPLNILTAKGVEISAIRFLDNSKVLKRKAALSILRSA